MTIKTVDLHRNYFSCFGKRKKFLPKNWATKFLFKLLLVLILPILVIINQFRQFPLLLKIHKEKERLQTTEKQSTCFKIKKFFKSFKKLCVDKNNESINYDDEKLVEHIEDAMRKGYERPYILSLYDKLIPLTEDKFLEAFIESAPQMILQIKIVFASECPWETIFIISIISSFFNLAATITNYSVKFRQKNPALRQASLVGQIFLITSKVPFLLSRTFAISFIFALPKNGVFYGFCYMVFGTIIFATYEYSQMTSMGIAETIRKGNWFRFLVMLSTRGSVSYTHLPSPRDS